jgi:hypothetical protein
MQRMIPHGIGPFPRRRLRDRGRPVEVAANEFAVIVKTRFRRFWIFLPSRPVKPSCGRVRRRDTASMVRRSGSRSHRAPPPGWNTRSHAAPARRNPGATRRRRGIISSRRRKSTTLRAAFRGHPPLHFPERAMWFDEKQCAGRGSQVQLRVIESWGVFRSARIRSSAGGTGEGARRVRAGARGCRRRRHHADSAIQHLRPTPR